MNIEIRHIQYFLAAAEHGSFRGAAMALGIQESAISRRIRDLEDQLGAALFQRHSGGVQLTLAGQCFIRRAHKGLRQIDDGAREVAAVGRVEYGHIKIGIISSIASGFLLKLLHAYDERHSGVTIGFIDGGPSEHMAAIRHFQLDVAFVTGVAEWSGCDTACLWTERAFIVLPQEHILTRRRAVGWPELIGENFIVSDLSSGRDVRNYIIRHISQFNRESEIQFQYVGRDNLLPLVALGHGLTVISEASTVVRIPGVSYRPIRDETLLFSAVWSPKNDNPALRRLLSMAKAMSGNAVKSS